ncbi:MAG: MATE family efflux transporter [Oscillospiraceae bacterium]|nr:MATE family efflux transporter [Oscillospiraceae bacterium]MBQ2861597.1 MATE family efflux transporter [Oscillospiraceae bacterium]
MIAVIWSLAWPTMLEQAMQTAVQYIDTAMVGSLGTAATAAVGSTSTVNWLISSSISAMSIGFLAFIAKARGAGDDAKARRAVGQSVLAVLVFGSFFTVLALSLSGMVPVWMQVDANIRDVASQYFFIVYVPMLPRAASIIFGTVLRASGDTKTPMKIGVIMNIINIVLNFMLIYETRVLNIFGIEFTMPGAGLGVIGAAIASAVAFTAGGILITIVLWKHPYLSPKGQKIAPDAEILRPCLKVAFPNMLQRFGTSLGFVAFASMINSLGEVSTAAHTIANTVESAFYIPGFGMQTAAATLNGNAYGAKDKQRMHDLANMFIPIEVALMVISGASLFALAPSLMDIFSDSAEVIALGSTVLRMVAVSEPFYGFSIIIEGMMQGVGRTKEPFVYNIIGMWGIRIVGTFIFTQLFDMTLVAAWGCMIAHNMFLFFMFLRCFIKGKWNPLIDEKA